MCKAEIRWQRYSSASGKEETCYFTAGRLNGCDHTVAHHDKTVPWLSLSQQQPLKVEERGDTLLRVFLSILFFSLFSISLFLSMALLPAGFVRLL